MDEIIGPVTAPLAYENWGKDLAGLSAFMNAIIKLIIVVAGLYAFFNLVMAGYGFMSAGDDPKKMTAAWSKIWQSILGLAIAAGSFVLAAIIGRLLYGDEIGWGMLLQLQLFGPLDF